MGSTLDLQQLQKAVFKPTLSSQKRDATSYCVDQPGVAHPCMLCQHFFKADFYMENRSALDFKYTQPDV